MMHLYQDVAFRKTVFIRLNPDEYILNGESIDSSFHISKNGVVIKRTSEFDRRFGILKDAVDEHFKTVPGRDVTIVKLCFDE